MEDFEKLGQFYLGKRYSLSESRLEADLVMYDAKDLVTHGVCVGMTGSGKTGLCIALLEEAAIDSIPAIIIDPKGDMANLLLTFPNLSGDEFLPWVNADDAARANKPLELYASEQAGIWKKGLEEWGQSGQRIRKLRGSVDFAIYTPGSASGLPVSVLNSFSCPADAIMEDREAAADLITSAASSLLGLIGIQGDPISSRENILIANIIQHHWKQGRDVDIALLIRSIQAPPFERVGAFITDSFYPEKDRYELALKLNNLLAAPGFATWLEGEPLDAGRFLYTPDGRPRISVFSIAHLADAERMFFITLLLNQVVAWMRTQPGTTSLRALVYMDEVAGYLPPIANPPTKKPLMILFKQARAFGVGVLLATQNPVDLDYKALSNAGTWFIGRLQTAQDIGRLVKGLGVGSAEAEAGLQNAIAALGKRTFLLKNVHEDGPEIFQTRWCLSYLRGPLTLAQIKSLKSQRIAESPIVSANSSSIQATGSIAAAAAGRPGLPPGISECFMPFRGAKPGGATPFYKPMICALGDIHFAGGQSQRRVCLAELSSETFSISWDESQSANFDDSLLEREPVSSAEFAPLAAAASKTENYKAWTRDFGDFLFRTSKTDIFKNAEFRLSSNPGESESDFRIRISQLAREKRDTKLDALRNKYGPKIAALQDRVRRAEQRVQKEKADVRQAGLQTAISFGATLLGAFMGRKTFSAGNIGRASTTMRGGIRTAKEQSDIAAAAENLEILRQQQADLESEFNAEMQSLSGSADPLKQAIETTAQRPKKADVAVRLLTLVWVPYWKKPDGTLQSAS